jgi:DNA-binding IclR family transcriptional regulator
MQTAATGFLSAEYCASSCDDVLLCAAVYIGQCEGRLMTAGKLAEYIGMPRPTAFRKLHTLKERGVLDVSKSGRWCVSNNLPEISAKISRSVDALVPIIHRAAAELSKLDAKPIARSEKR